MLSCIFLYTYSIHAYNLQKFTKLPYSASDKESLAFSLLKTIFPQLSDVEIKEGRYS